MNENIALVLAAKLLKHFRKNRFTVYVVSDTTATFEREGMNGVYYPAHDYKKG